MKELMRRWHCQECRMASRNDQILSAPNPFDPEDRIYGCPHCLQIGALVGACQHIGCSRMSSSGTPKVDGFRYVNACMVHSPYDGKFIADPDLILPD